MKRIVPLLGATVLALVMTWPIAPNLGRIGRVASTDAMYAMWNVSWVARALTSNPSGVFDANIFHPHTKTLAYSESNLLTGALGIPAWLATENVYATYNSVTLLGFILSFLCMYALAFRLTGSAIGAAVAAIGFAYCPYVYARFPHIQLQMTFGMPLSMLALHALVDAPSWRRGMLLGAALAVQALTCAYYGILAGLLVGLGVLVFAATRRAWKSRDYWIAIAVAVATLLVIVGPAFIPYLSIQEAGFERTLEEASRYSFGWRAWLASPSRLHTWMLPLIGWKAGVLFPGFVLGVCGIAALVASVLRRRRLDQRTREAAIFYSLAGLLALWLTLGPPAGLYTLFYYTVPVFKMLRAPERFGIAVSLALAVGTAFTVARLARRARERRGPRGAAVFAAAALTVAIADTWIAPIGGFRGLAVARPYHRLASLQRGPVAEFPWFERSVDLHRHAEYMFFSTYHWKPLINGYSDYMPKDFLDTATSMSHFPSDTALGLLKERGARYVLVHLNYYQHQREAEVARGLAHYVSQGILRFIDRDVRHDEEGDRVYDVSLYEIVRYP